MPSRTRTERVHGRRRTGRIDELGELLIAKHLLPRPHQKGTSGYGMGQGPGATCSLQISHKPRAGRCAHLETSCISVRMVCKDEDLPVGSKQPRRVYKPSKCRGCDPRRGRTRHDSRRDKKQKHEHTLVNKSTQRSFHVRETNTVHQLHVRMLLFRGGQPGWHLAADGHDVRHNDLKDLLRGSSHNAAHES